MGKKKKSERREYTHNDDGDGLTAATAAAGVQTAAKPVTCDMTRYYIKAAVIIASWWLIYGFILNHITIYTFNGPILCTNAPPVSRRTHTRII